MFAAYYTTSSSVSVQPLSSSLSTTSQLFAFGCNNSCWWWHQVTVYEALAPARQSRLQEYSGLLKDLKKKKKKEAKPTAGAPVKSCHFHTKKILGSLTIYTNSRWQERRPLPKAKMARGIKASLTACWRRSGAPTVIVFLLWPALTIHQLAPGAMRETTQPSVWSARILILCKDGAAERACFAA